MHTRTCSMHGKYLIYEDHLKTIKNYSIVFVTFFMLIIALILYYVNLSLGWLYLFMGIIVGPAVLPITLSLFWPRINSFSMFISLISGCCVGIISWIVATVMIYNDFNITVSGK
jgi:Na+/proline symporter